MYVYEGVDCTSILSSFASVSALRLLAYGFLMRGVLRLLLILAALSLPVPSSAIWRCSVNREEPNYETHTFEYVSSKRVNALSFKCSLILP